MSDSCPGCDSHLGGAPTPAGALTCREFADCLMAYEDGELPSAERARCAEHLAVCPDCVTYLKGYRAAVALAQKAFVDEDADAADEAPEELVRAILAARRRRRH